MDQRRDPQTWTILRFLLPSQLRVKSTLSPGTGGNKLKSGMKPTRVSLLAPQRTGTSSEESGRAGSRRQRPRRCEGPPLALAAEHRTCCASVSLPYFYLFGVFPHADLFPTWIQFQVKGLRETTRVQCKRGGQEGEERGKRNPQGENESREAEVAAARSISAASRLRALNTLRDARVWVCVWACKCARAPTAASLPRPPPGAGPPARGSYCSAPPFPSPGRSPPH